MVVDACFIASQIDVWTQAYNGPTSRRKYVLNLLNVLHKNVTEEYKTDQFLHVIYWFLIYKSNLGHFFRNEGIFSPLLLLFFFHQLLRAQTSPPSQVPAGTATSRTCMCVHTCAHMWCTLLFGCLYVHSEVCLEAADFGWKGQCDLCSICVTSPIWSWKLREEGW